MAKSCRQLIVEGLKARFETVPALETVDGAYLSVAVEVNRRAPIDQGTELPRLILFDTEESAIDLFATENHYRLAFALQGAVRRAGEDATAVANTLRAEAIKALLADQSLGGKVRAIDLTEAGDFFGVDEEADCEGFLLGFAVEYGTKENDPFTFA